MTFLTVDDRTAPTESRSARRLPCGPGLMIGASASLGLWAGLILILARVA